MQAHRTGRQSGQHLRRRPNPPALEFVGDEAGHPVTYGVEERDRRRRLNVERLAAVGADVDEITAATGLRRDDVERALARLGIAEEVAS